MGGWADVIDVSVGVLIGVSIILVSMNLWLFTLFLVLYVVAIWWKDNRLIPWLDEKRAKRQSA